MNHNMYGCHVFRVVVGLCVAFICWTIMVSNIVCFTFSYILTQVHVIEFSVNQIIV